MLAVTAHEAYNRMGSGAIVAVLAPVLMRGAVSGTVPGISPCAAPGNAPGATPGATSSGAPGAVPGAAMAAQGDAAAAAAAAVAALAEARQGVQLAAALLEAHRRAPLSRKPAPPVAGSGRYLYALGLTSCAEKRVLDSQQACTLL